MTNCGKKFILNETVHANVEIRAKSIKSAICFAIGCSCRKGCSGTLIMCVKVKGHRDREKKRARSLSNDSVHHASTAKLFKLNFHPL